MINNIYIKFILISLTFLLHEIGHVIAIKACGVTLRGIKFIGIGARIVIDNKWLSSKQKIGIYLMGPLMNIACVMLFILVPNKIYTLDFIKINISMFIINILPVIPLDGSKIIEVILEKRIGINRSKKILIKLSNICIVIMSILGIIQIIEHRNFNILIIVAYIKKIMLREGERMTNLRGMERILLRKERFLKKGFYPIRHIAVLSEGIVSDVLRNLDFDSIHIINVLDKNFNLVAVINEEELLNQLIDKGSNITFNDIKF